jgi:hypothetical protein
MAQKLKWKVIREHTGDRFYPEGDVRIGTKADLGALEGRLLELIGPDENEAGDETASESADEAAAEKAEPEHLNKAEDAAPANKADSQRKSKRR